MRWIIQSCFECMQHVTSEEHPPILQNIVDIYKGVCMDNVKHSNFQNTILKLTLNE